MAEPIDTRRIRLRMRELESTPDRERSVIAAISEISGLSEPGEPIDGRLLAALHREIRRVEEMAAGHYSEWADMTPRNLIALGFLQGATFLAAVRDLLDAAERDHPERSWEQMIEDAPPDVREFLTSLDDDVINFILQAGR